MLESATWQLEPSSNQCLLSIPAFTAKSIITSWTELAMQLTQLGPYEILESLGAGGMGQVYKARHTVMDRIVAVKLIRGDKLIQPELVARFHREIQAAAKLNHPNIVSVFDAGEYDGSAYLTMEFCDGIDLGRYVQQHGPLSVSHACDVFRQLALGLQHAHDAGLVHRDIKPANVMLVGAQVKILDLGLARFVQSPEYHESQTQLTGEGSVMGTVDFLAPEQARDSRAADTRSDLYSLGCTLYFALAGHAPFPGGTATEKLLKHQLDTPPSLELASGPRIPAEIQATLDQLLSKNPDSRPQSAESVALLLADLAEPTHICNEVINTLDSADIGTARTLNTLHAPSLPPSVTPPSAPTPIANEQPAPNDSATPETTKVSVSHRKGRLQPFHKKVAVGTIAIVILASALALLSSVFRTGQLFISFNNVAEIDAPADHIQRQNTYIKPQLADGYVGQGFAADRTNGQLVYPINRGNNQDFRQKNGSIAFWFKASENLALTPEVKFLFEIEEAVSEVDNSQLPLCKLYFNQDHLTFAMRSADQQLRYINSKSDPVFWKKREWVYISASWDMSAKSKMKMMINQDVYENDPTDVNWRIDNPGLALELRIGSGHLVSSGTIDQFQLR